jgi:hypothetical protein
MGFLQMRGDMAGQTREQWLKAQITQQMKIAEQEEAYAMTKKRLRRDATEH